MSRAFPLTTQASTRLWLLVGLSVVFESAYGFGTLLSPKHVALFVPKYSTVLLFSRNSRATLSVNMIGNTDIARREEGKKKLLGLISSNKRNKDLNSAEKDLILAAMQELERLNPCENPVESALLSGKWSLLFTGAAEEAVALRRKKEGMVGSLVTEVTGASESGESESELPLGRRITTTANSLVQNKGNFQDIDASESYVENRAAFALAGVPVELKIQGRCDRVEEEEKRAMRLAVYFERVLLRVGDFQLLSIPLTWSNGGKGPEGWVDTTYLDESMRLGRGDKGSFFVTVRRPE